MAGFWPSPFTARVLWALKLKGVNFEYVEEDLPNKKSDLLLRSNPVHKQVPVLVHGGRAVAESLVILEYVEEIWPENPLLPIDPYDRAVARFWIWFLVDKSPKLRGWFSSAGQKQANNAVAEVQKVMRTIEERALGDKQFFGGESINMVDVVYGVLAYWLPAMEEVIGTELLNVEALPRLAAWAFRFRQSPVIRDNLPDHDKMVAYLAGLVEKMSLRSS